MNIVPMNFDSEQDNTLLAPFLAHCERAPDVAAIRTSRGEISYAGLRAAVASFAGALDARGVGPDDIVALHADDSPESIALLLAIVANGAAYLPLLVEHADLRLTAMIEEAQPRLLIGDRSLRAALPLAGQWIECSELVSPQSRLDVKTSGTLAYVLFTMGLNGRTNGVAMRTRAAATLVDWQRRHLRLGKPARTLQFAALDTETAFQEIFSTLGTGGTLVLASQQERRDLSALLNLLRRERIERAFLPNAIVEMLAAVVARRTDALPSTLLDVITTGKQLLFTPELRALFGALHDCVLHIHYGPARTEAVAAQELSGDVASWPQLAPAGGVMSHARSAPGADGPSSGMWQRSSVAARAAALLRAARAAGGGSRTDQRASRQRAAFEKFARQGNV